MLARYIEWFNNVGQFATGMRLFVDIDKIKPCKKNKARRYFALMKTEVTKLLDDIMRILKKQKRSIADLARDLDRNYNQVYHWVVVRRFNPSGTAILELKQWRDRWHAASL